MRKKILWLCSWYPDKLEPFNGDFVQRHAQAASQFNDIYVLHVVADSSGNISKIEHSVTQTPGLTEHIIYFPKKQSALGRLKAYYKWLSLYTGAVEEYILKFGKPDLVHVHVP